MPNRQLREKIDVISFEKRSGYLAEFSPEGLLLRWIFSGRMLQKLLEISKKLAREP